MRRVTARFAPPPSRLPCGVHMYTGSGTLVKEVRRLPTLGAQK
jgi:hypothetical protein